MPRLPTSFKKMMGKGEKSRRPDSDGASVGSTTASSFDSRIYSGFDDDRDQGGVASLIYS
jgi:hypothetical protein